MQKTSSSKSGKHTKKEKMKMTTSLITKQADRFPDRDNYRIPTQPLFQNADPKVIE
jgi:hypothetical protein